MGKRACEEHRDTHGNLVVNAIVRNGQLFRWPDGERLRAATEGEIAESAAVAGDPIAARVSPSLTSLDERYTPAKPLR